VIPPQSTLNAPTIKPRERTAVIIKSRASKRKAAPFGVEVTDDDV
jgi:hypothetical protein